MRHVLARRSGCVVYGARRRAERRVVKDPFYYPVMIDETKSYTDEEIEKLAQRIQDMGVKPPNKWESIFDKPLYHNIRKTSGTPLSPPVVGVGQLRLPLASVKKDPFGHPMFYPITGNTVTAVTAPDPHFPHKCDACGKDAYNGALRTDHRFPADAARCMKK